MSSLSFSCENNINHYRHKIKCFSRLRGRIKNTSSIYYQQSNSQPSSKFKQWMIFLKMKLNYLQSKVGTLWTLPNSDTVTPDSLSQQQVTAQSLCTFGHADKTSCWTREALSSTSNNDRQQPALIPGEGATPLFRDWNPQAFVTQPHPT